MFFPFRARQKVCKADVGVSNKPEMRHYFIPITYHLFKNRNMKKFGLLVVINMFVFCFIAMAQSKEMRMANRILHSVDTKYAPDKRTAIFSLKSVENSGQLVLKGQTNLPEAKRELLDSLSLQGIRYRDSIVVLPEVSLGSKIWGLATISVANMRTGPDHANELASQVLMGTPVKILAAVEGWLQVQTPDQYIGWVDELGIALKTESEMATWKQSKRFVFNEMTGYALSAPEKRASPISDLVLDDLFELVSEVKGYLQVRFPDGRTAFVKKGDCISYREWTNRTVDLQSVLSVAKQLLGVPYLWGGTSSKAVDCSGYTKTSYYSQAIILARDASQQARYGEHPDFTDHKNLHPGDLLFFGRTPQRITHVGLYLGSEDYVNASGFVRVNSIDPNDQKFKHNDRKSLVSASRILNSLNTEGIIQVKNHPWY
jgi:gamma-D-glutamyl-L-lysine dipeptidyl-peptidase